MTTTYRGPGGSVEVNPVNLPRAVQRVVDAVIKGAKKGGKQSLIDIREMIQNGIRDNSLGLNPLKDSTIAARRAGKDGGAWPERPRKMNARPLDYTGQTVKGIKVNINNDVMSLGFDESATISYSKVNMERAAYYQEYGFTIRGKYTKKMLAYLHVLFRKQFGEREHGRKRWAQNNKLSTRGARVGMAYTRKVDPRPAWRKATIKAFPIVEINFRTAILNELKKTGLVIEET